MLDKKKELSYRIHLKLNLSDTHSSWKGYLIGSLAPKINIHLMAYTHSIYIPNIYLSYMYLLKTGARVAQWVRSYSTERDIPWSITVIVVMSRRVMGIKILNSCGWSGGNKTPGVNLVILDLSQFYSHMFHSFSKYFQTIYWQSVDFKPLTN
jgi:hypothetical protein